MQLAVETLNSISDVNQLSYLLGMFEIDVGAHPVVPSGLGNLSSQRSAKMSDLYIYVHGIEREIHDNPQLVHSLSSEQGRGDLIL